MLGETTRTLSSSLYLYNMVKISTKFQIWKNLNYLKLVFTYYWEMHRLATWQQFVENYECFTVRHIALNTHESVFLHLTDAVIINGVVTFPSNAVMLYASNISEKRHIQNGFLKNNYILKIQISKQSAVCCIFFWS